MTIAMQKLYMDTIQSSRMFGVLFTPHNADGDGRIAPTSWRLRS